MPKAIKAFSFNNTTAATTTIYTCPASTVAKVIATTVQLKDAAALNIGFFSLTSVSTKSISVNPGRVAAVDGETYSPAVPLEVYLAAGQAITTVVGSGGIAKAQLCVIEEVTS